jgi:DNA (cytosine-5)-methyltransferase 1
VNVLALCAGIGGLELGIKIAEPRARVVCYVERDPFACRVLEARIADRELDDAPIWCGDLFDFDARRWRGVVDCVAAGFPCQPFSTASRGRKVALDLYPAVRRAVVECAPGRVFLENVQPGPIARAAFDLQAAGYEVRVARVCASQLGAPHRRPRWWLFADAYNQAQPNVAVDDEVACLRAASRDRWERHPRPILGMDDGISGRVDPMRCLGNAVVPAQAALAWRLLA